MFRDKAEENEDMSRIDLPSKQVPGLSVAICITASRFFQLAFRSATAARFTRIQHLTRKMKAALVLFVLACALALATSDLVCGTNYCKQHPCTTPVASKSCRSPAIYKPNHSGKCACCPACVTLLAENAACKTYSKELGETPSAVCREPLRCLGGVCTKASLRV